jgi:hypothetical protein
MELTECKRKKSRNTNGYCPPFDSTTFYVNASMLPIKESKSTSIYTCNATVLIK